MKTENMAALDCWCRFLYIKIIEIIVDWCIYKEKSLFVYSEDSKAANNLFLFIYLR